MPAQGKPIGPIVGLIGVILLLIVVANIPQELQGGLAVIIISGVFYFLPSVVGRHKANFPAIFFLNLVLGWTGVGWIVAMVWALTKDAPSLARQGQA